jgi:hypothetical protein
MSSKAVKGQLNLFPEKFIKDADCTKDTPVILGKKDAPVYTGRNGTVRENVGNDGGPSREELYTIVRKQIGGKGHETRYKSEDHALRGI